MAMEDARHVVDADDDTDGGGDSGDGAAVDGGHDKSRRSRASRQSHPPNRHTVTCQQTPRVTRLFGPVVSSRERVSVRRARRRTPEPWLASSCGKYSDLWFLPIL